MLAAAVPGADATPPGGVKVDGGLRLEIRDGVFAAWARRDAPGTGSPLGDLGPMDDLVAQGVAAGRARGMI